MHFINSFMCLLQLILINNLSCSNWHALLSHPLWFDCMNNIWKGVYVIKLLSMRMSPASHYFLPLRCKLLPQLSTLTIPWSAFYAECQRPSFIPIHKNGKLYLYILIFMFLNISRRTEDYQNLICYYILWLLSTVWNQQKFATFLKDALDIFKLWLDHLGKRWWIT
jgi:hypothetical protein